MIIDELVVDRVPGATYDWRDLNRVAEAMEYVADKIRAAGYVVRIQTRRFRRDEFPTESAVLRYIDQVRILREVLTLPPTAPPVPGSSRERPWLTVQEANDIETILATIDRLLRNMQAAWYYSGDLFAGEV